MMHDLAVVNKIKKYLMSMKSQDRWNVNTTCSGNFLKNQSTHQNRKVNITKSQKSQSQTQ